MGCSIRDFGGVVDSFLSIWRRLIVVLALFVCVGQAHADTIYSDWQAALTSCKSSVQTANNNHRANITGCLAGTYSTYNEWYLEYEYSSTIHTVTHLDFPYRGAVPPENPCGSLATVSIFLDGKVLSGYSFPQSAVDQVTGATVQCAMTATPKGAPVWNQWSNKWQTYAQLSPTGDLAGGDGVTDGSGAGVADVPVPPSYDNQPTTPGVCGGGSCYDAASDQYCASSGGSQYCVSGAAARSSSGGCSGSAAVTCGGSPSAPLPAQSQVPDPATQAVGSDHYTQADPQTGTSVPVVVNVYKGATNPNGVTSGQQSGDSGPASASSTGNADGSSYSGGGDCNSPPVCSGDAAMCGAARTQWATTCQVHKDLAGTGQPSDFDTLKTKYSQSDVWSDPDTSMDGTEGGQANQGNYNQSGFGWSRACPLQDWHIELGDFGSFTVPLQDKCYVGDWIRYLVIGMGLFLAAIITAGGKGGG